MISPRTYNIFKAVHNRPVDYSGIRCVFCGKIQKVGFILCESCNHRYDKALTGIFGNNLYWIVKDSKSYQDFIKRLMLKRLEL